MAEKSTTKKSTTKTKATKATKPRPPKAARLLNYLLDYLETQDVGIDASVDVVIKKLEQSIVNEALTEVRS